MIKIDMAMKGFEKQAQSVILLYATAFGIGIYIVSVTDVSARVVRKVRL